MIAEGKGMLQEAREWLLRELADGPRYTTDLKAEADARSIRWENVKRVVRQLGIATGREQVNGEWLATWFLPAQAGAPVAQSDDPQGASGTAPFVDTAIANTKRVAAPLNNLARMLATLRVQGTGAEIWRYVDGQPAYVTTIPASQFSLQWVKAKLGGGRFAVSGHEFSIEGEPREYLDDVPQRAAVAAQPVTPPPAPAVAVTPDLLTQMFVQQMKANQDMMMQMLASKAATADPMEMALKIANMLHQAPPPVTPVDQAMALIEKGMKIGAEASGADEDGMSRVTKLAEPLLAWLTRAALTKATNAGTHGSEPGANPARETSMDLKAIGETLVPYLPDLITHARQGTHVESVATYLIEHADGTTLDALDAHADAVNFQGELMGVISRHIPPETVPWFTNLIQAVRRELVDSRPDPNGASPG